MTETKYPIAVFDLSDSNYYPVAILTHHYAESMKWCSVRQPADGDRIVEEALRRPDKRNIFLRYLETNKEMGEDIENYYLVYDEETLRSLIRTLEV